MKGKERQNISFKNLEDKYKEIVYNEVRDKALSTYRTIPMHVEFVSFITNGNLLQSIASKLEALILRETEREVSVTLNSSEVLEYYNFRLSTR